MNYDYTCAKQSNAPSPIYIVCGIGGLVVGAVGWLEERQKLELGLGVPAGAVTVLAA
ncbi:jg20948, partial [Pararge aegeria aegeria]